MEEKLIKSKERVKNHGEVFTPKFIVHKMLNLPGVSEAKTDISKTVLEPSAGEGIFLVELLKMRLDYITKKHKDSIIDYENDSLIALSTMYGVELLKDNSQKCVANIIDTYMEYYRKYADNAGLKINENIKKSAITIISSNNLLGNFLTEKDSYGNELFFSEWKIVGKTKKGYYKIQRTEYTLEEIRNNIAISNGEYKLVNKNKQLSFFAEDNKEFEEKYIAVSIDKLWKEEIKRRIK